MVGWMDKQTDELTDELTDGWMDRQIGSQIYTWIDRLGFQVWVTAKDTP